MKQLIAILRLLGVVSLIIAIILRVTEHYDACRLFIYITLGFFAMILFLQLYRFYIKNYLQKEELDN